MFDIIDLLFVFAQGLIPHMAQEYGFEYELITYKWPTWLHKQTEKQRIIWAYKILFLDVIFPLSLEKVSWFSSSASNSILLFCCLLHSQFHRVTAPHMILKRSENSILHKLVCLKSPNFSGHFCGC